MKFELNGIEWKIEEITKESLNNKYINTHDGEFDKELYVFGLCEKNSGTIYLNWDLTKTQKICTLKHELTHAYLWSVGMQFEEFVEEDICNVVAASNEFINDIVKKYAAYSDALL